MGVFSWWLIGIIIISYYFCHKCCDKLLHEN